MNNKPFEQWWAGLRDVGELKVIKAIDLKEGKTIHIDELGAQELHAQIIEAADYAMPCTIMRRFAQMDDSPLGCYVPVAYCDHYGAFEELIEAAGKPHALICIQRQEERRKPKAEPIDMSEREDELEAECERHNETIQKLNQVTVERGELTKKLEEYGTEIAHLKSQQLDEGQRQLVIMGLADCVLNCPGFEFACREVAEHLNGVVMFDHFKVTRARFKTPSPSDEQPEPELGHLQGGSIVLESRGESVKTIRLDDIHDAFLHEDRISIVTAGKQIDTVCFSSKAKLKAQWDAIQQNISARGMRPEPDPEPEENRTPPPSGETPKAADPS